MAKDDDSLTSYLLKYADKAAKSVSQAYGKTMGMPEEIAKQTYDYVIAQGGTEEQARGIAGRLASDAGRTTAALDFMIPQSAADVALMAAGPLGPATKAGKAALAAGSGLMVMEPTEAEAGPLNKMRKGLANFMEGSVLREKDGDPTRLYHGSKSDIKYFDTNHPDRKDAGWMGRGVYAFDSPAGANLYAMTKRGPVGENITPLYGRLTNPYEFTMAEKKAMSTMGQDKIDEFTNELVRKGHDGAILKYPDGTREVVVYDPKMVKSAIGNTGDYDMTTDLLTKRAGGAVQGYARGGPVTTKSLNSLYQDYFGREGDEGGLKHWQGAADVYGLTLDDIGKYFADTDESRDQYAKLEQSIGGQRAADTTQAAPWKTWWGYTPNKKDYDMMLRAGLGEYGLTDDPNQVLGIYEAIGNRAAANNFLEKNAYAYDKTRPSGRFAKTLADQITEDQVEGAYATGRINSLLNSKDPAKMAIVQQARNQLLNYFTLGQNKVLGSQTDWRGFDPVTGEPSTGAAWRNYKGDAGRVVPGSEGLPMYNTFYNPKYRPDLQVKIANLQGQRNAIWGAPLPASRPSDTVLAQVQIFTDDDGRKSIFKDGVQTYIDEQEAAALQASNDAEANDQIFTDEDNKRFAENNGVRNYLNETNPFDTNQTVGGVETANVGADNGDDYRYAFNPNVTPGADTGLGVSTFDPSTLRVYRNDSIDQNAIQQNQLANTASNWQQDFNNVVGGQFNMSNPGLVGGYNSSNIGGFDYSGLGASLGNVGATSGFNLNTNYNFGDNSGFGGGGYGGGGYGGGGYGGFGGGGFGMDYAEGGGVDLDKILEGQVAQAEALPPELAPADVEMAPLEAIKAASAPVNPRAGTGIGGALSRIGQGIADSAIVRGASEIPGTVANYFSDVTAGPDPSQRLGQDLGKLGSMVYEGVKADPVGAILDVLPVVGEIRSGMDASKYSDAAVEAEIAGDEPRASMFRQLAAMSTAGAAPILGVGARLAKRGAKAGTEGAEAFVREGSEAATREGMEGAAREGMEVVTEHPAMIDTRYPTGKARIDEVEGERLLADFASMKATPKLYEDNVNLVKGYVNMPESSGSGLTDDVAENFINHAKDNLLYLHDQVPDNIRQRSQLWYDGARKISEDWANEYGISDSAAAGALAALSPQKDWYQNVSLAKRVVDALKGNGENFYNGFAFSPEMQTTYESIASLNKPAYSPLFDQIKGRSLGDINKLDLPDDEKAILKSMWIRLYDEGHNSKAYPIVTPEGGFGDPVKTGKGADARVAWGSMNEISKAIRAIESNGDPKLLNEIMGGKHKVRNFYNNILAPNSARGDVTIDTHAVAASLMRPLSQKSVEVAHNFKTSTPGGLPGASGSAASGIQGTYPLYAEAYRRAAEERGILPRQMQSITWEAVRGLFPDTFKTPKNMEAVDALWAKYRAGEASLDETREAVSKFAGGVNPPTWYRPSGAADETLQGAGDAPVVSGSGIPRKASGGVVGRGRGQYSQEPSRDQVGYAEGGEVNFKKMFEGDSEAMQERARELAREAYSKGYGSLGKKKADEWETLARKYNLPLSVGPFDNYEDQYSDAVSKWQRGLSPKQRVQNYAEGGAVTPYNADEIAALAKQIYEGTNG